MKQKELKFDIEKINDMKKSLSDSADDLNTYKDKVIQSLDKLKKDWNTAAGKNFMQNVDTDWTKEVENYIKIIGAVEELLEEAATQYEKLEDEVDKIKFY